MDLTFQPFQKIARLSRDIVITEKIDGTNAQVLIAPSRALVDAGVVALAYMGDPDFETSLGIVAASRSRYLTLTDDNFGFAKWVQAHADDLFLLGAGRHFGEWWGSGIQRGYGLPKGEKRFSLFNVARWHRDSGAFVSVSNDPRQPPSESANAPSCCYVVPVLYRGAFDLAAIQGRVDVLASNGSVAAPGFMKPEGVVVYHTASGTLFKKTVEKDEAPKGRTL